jgi:cobalt-zinc-cadmium efflux system membrane fusion protein
VNQAFPLRTPLPGIVVERNVTPGQEVRPDQMLASMPQLVAPLFVVTNPNRLWLMLDVPEQDVASVHAGEHVDIHVKALPGRVFHGTLTLVSAAIDPASRTLKVRGVVDNPDGALKAEMLVSVDAPRSSADLVVPVSAVILDGDTHVVFVQDKPTEFTRRVVETGPASDGTIAIRRGVGAGERVVTQSTLLLEQLFQRASHS